MSKPTATPLPPLTSSRMGSSNAIGAARRHRPDDTSLHARGRTQQHRTIGAGRPRFDKFLRSISAN
jgi:hypothetical protein